MALLMFDPPRIDEILPDFRPSFYLLATICGADFGIKLHGTEDAFMPVFTNEEALNAFMVQFTKNHGVLPVWEIVKVTQIDAVHQVAEEKHLRVMIDPVIVSPSKTRWKERVKDGDIFKYRAAEN